jgi:hypothetical protein
MVRHSVFLTRLLTPSGGSGETSGLSVGARLCPGLERHEALSLPHAPGAPV